MRSLLAVLVTLCLGMAAQAAVADEIPGLPFPQSGDGQDTEMLVPKPAVPDDYVCRSCTPLTGTHLAIVEWAMDMAEQSGGTLNEVRDFKRIQRGVWTATAAYVFDMPVDVTTAQGRKRTRGTFTWNVETIGIACGGGDYAIRDLMFGTQSCPPTLPRWDGYAQRKLIGDRSTSALDPTPSDTSPAGLT